MKLRVFWGILICIFNFHNAYACCGEAADFFKKPSYIDNDYKVGTFNYREYDLKDRFNLITDLYLKTNRLNSANLNANEQIDPHEDAQITDNESEEIPNTAAQQTSSQTNISNSSTANTTTASNTSATISPDANARDMSKLQEPANYANYLKAAENFNAGRHEDALKIFTDLKNNQSKPPLKNLWTKEASTYMIARCHLAIAQKNWDGADRTWDESGHIQDIDQDRLKQAEASYQLYLKEYPYGWYANSARNISRKIFYLSNNQSALNEALKKAMLEAFPIAVSANTKPNPDINIVHEFENRFQGEINLANDAPILIAYHLLKNPNTTPQEVSLLEKRKNDFARYPGLFRYLYALSLYHSKQYQTLLKQIPEETLTKNTLSLSTEFLRYKAFLELQRFDEALLSLNNMYAVSPEDAIELNMATLKLNVGEGLWLFTEKCPIKTEWNLRTFAQFGLSDQELEKGIHDRQIVQNKHQYLVDELAKRYLLNNHFEKLTQLLQQEPNTRFLSSIQSSIFRLTKDANNTEALANVGEFLYQNYFSPNSIFHDYVTDHYNINPSVQLLTKDVLANAFKERSKEYIAPIYYFRKVVSLVKNSGKKSEAEAKALHYITICNRGDEFKDRCTWGESITVNSKDAFNRLHLAYQDSPWTAKTPYYY